MLSPFDGMRVSSSTATMPISGFLTAANTEVKLEYLNASTNVWTAWKSGNKSAATVSRTMADGQQLFAWTYPDSAVPAAAWKAGTGGSVARVRAFYVGSDGSRTYLLLGRADQASCMLVDDYPADINGRKNTVGYVANNCFSQRAEAYIYTTGYREGPSTCAAPPATLAKTNGHYMLDQLTNYECASKIVYDHMAQRINAQLLDDHYRIEHMTASAAGYFNAANGSAFTHPACTDTPSMCCINGQCNLGGIFAGHERYITEMERWMMVYDYPWAPGGKIPSWSSVTTIPANFSTDTTHGWRVPVSSPDGNCYSQASTCNGWLSSALSNPNPNQQMPSALSPANVCSNTSPAALANNTFTWHANVHNAVGGGFSTFDSPAFPLFFLWHNSIEDVWKNWKACGISF
ncbi:MAG TPA: tyrosinase family protein [Polyangiales bacterium]|nr:tyrosinase family protein [Polyangiales bacterium]